MKKLITAIALFVSLAAAGQNATGTPYNIADGIKTSPGNLVPKDSIIINDSTALIQARYFNYFLSELKEKIKSKLLVEEWDELMTIVGQVVNQSAADLRRRREKK